ncbi:MAG: extracellular solute-binding protein [Cetobacterium sp.]
MKRKIAMGALLLSALMFNGCSNDKDSKDVGTAKGKDKNLSVFLVFNGMPLSDEWEVYKKAEEATGVKIKSYASKNNTDSTQAYNLMLASNDFSDIIAYRVPDLEKLGSDGGMIPLNDLIDKHAPNIKKFIEENPLYRKDMYSLDGKIYAIPTYYDLDKLSVSSGLFIRTDWLKKFGLPVPKTLEETENALTIFKEQDANGNGRKDEVGIFVRGNIQAALNNLTGIFGARPYKTFYVENDQVTFATLDPNFKEAVKLSADWYKKGLIDKEVFTRGWGARDAVLPTNMGGMTLDWFGSTASYNSLSTGQIPGFEFYPMEPIQIKDGVKSVTVGRNTTPEIGWGISAASKNPEQAIKFMDWWFSEEGRRTWNFGIEGKHYTMVDGKPVFTDYVLKNPDGKGPLKVLQEVGAQVSGPGVQQDAEYEFQYSNDIAKQGFEMYMKDGNTKRPLPILKYSPKDIKELDKIMALVNQTTEEYMQKWILGVSDVDTDWDTYMSRIQQNGIERAKEIVQQGYNHYNSVK